MIKLININGFWDNYFWPGLLLLTTFIFGLLWDLFIKKKVKIKIVHKESYVGVFHGEYYTILKIEINNQTTIPINNLHFSTFPKYELIKNLTKTTEVFREIIGGRDTMIFPLAYSAIDNVIDPTVNQTVDSEHPLEGFVIIKNQQKSNRIKKFIVYYQNKKQDLNINYDSLQLKKI